jgi:hypothetical protein
VLKQEDMARLDTGWHAHPKIVGLGWAAMGLHCWSISYSDFHRTDGFVPIGAWPSLPGTRQAVHTLQTMGLWEPVVGGYMVHDYLDYNRSRADIEALEVARRAAGQAGGVAKAVAKAVASAKAKPLAFANPRSPDPGDAGPSGPSVSPRTPYPLSPNPDGGPIEAAPRAASTAQALATLYGPPPEPPERLPNGAQQCPLCPDLFTGTYAEHLESPRHKIHDEPADLSGFHA